MRILLKFIAYSMILAIAGCALVDVKENKSGPCNEEEILPSKYVEISFNPIERVDRGNSNTVLVKVPLKLDSNPIAAVSIRKQSDPDLDIPLRSVPWPGGDASGFAYFTFDASKAWLSDDYCVQVSYAISKYGHVSNVAKYFRDIPIVNKHRKQ